MTGRCAESFSRSAWVAEKRTSSPACANRPASMATMTGRSKTWLFGAILTMGWSCDGIALPHRLQERTRLVARSLRHGGGVDGQRRTRPVGCADHVGRADVAAGEVAIGEAQAR